MNDCLIRNCIFVKGILKKTILNYFNDNFSLLFSGKHSD